MRQELSILICASAVFTWVALWQVGVVGSASAPSIPDRGALLSVAPASEQQLLSDSGFANDLRLRNVNSGVAFYTFKRADGALCFLTGGSAACPASGEQSLFQGDPVAQVMRVASPTMTNGKLEVGPLLAWRGIALDGLARVAVIDASGREYSAPVVANTFELGGPIAHPETFKAYDANGKAVWAKTTGWPPR